MRSGLLLALLVLLALPGAALAAKPAPAWPTAQDIQTDSPGVRAGDAACLARYYHGRLPRTAFLKPLYSNTRAQIIVTRQGETRCMTKAERIASEVRSITSLVGPMPQAQCIASAEESEPVANILAQDTRAKSLADSTRIGRSCRMIGALYARTATETHLVLSAAAQTCANNTGALIPVLHRKGARIPKSQLAALGAVFDRCADRQAEETMYRWVNRNFQIRAQIPCIAHGEAASMTFVELLTNAASIKRHAQNAVATCLSANPVGG